MSELNVFKFFRAARNDPAMSIRYNGRNLSQLLFHAKNDGFDFNAHDLAEVIGRLEANLILNKGMGPYDGTSPLWRAMWGRPHLEYVIDHVVRPHTDDELDKLSAQKVASP